MSKYFKIEFPGVFLLDEDKFLKSLRCGLANLLFLIYEDKNKNDEMITLSCTINNNIKSSLKFKFSTLDNSTNDISQILIYHIYYEWLNNSCEDEDYSMYEKDIFTIEVI